MRRAFTLIELLVVVAAISLLLAVLVPAMRRVREQGAETVCRSNLRQLALILKTYTNDHDGMFPYPANIYHSNLSYGEEWKDYLACCRWHDARIGLDSLLLRHDRPELRGSLWSYLGNTKIVRCRVGVLANRKRGCYNACEYCVHDPRIEVVPQYTYTMNAYLNTIVLTGCSATGSFEDGIDGRTVRSTMVQKYTQVTRSHSEVFAFGEENSWAINTEGRQPIGVRPALAAPYNLSGKYYLEAKPHPVGLHGTIGSPALDIRGTYTIGLTADDRYIGDAFATCHRPRKGDLNTGDSFASMLDGHVEKITVADQLRKSRRIPGIEESRFGPGGNLALAWPLDVPPPGGWANQ
jgi:prepilin-type N-terminal cleavage/methylation domain-containing protein